MVVLEPDLPLPAHTTVQMVPPECLILSGVVIGPCRKKQKNNRNRVVSGLRAQAGTRQWVPPSRCADTAAGARAGKERGRRPLTAEGAGGVVLYDRAELGPCWLLGCQIRGVCE